MLALALCGSLLAPSVADAKAVALANAMTPQERLVLIRGESGKPLRNGIRTGALGSAGYVPGIPRLGIPALQETDATLGIANPDNVRRRDVATALASGLSLASTWDAQIAYVNGSILGDEAWRKGFNVLLGPGLNLTREPRGGRDFEYLGEDPLLAGTLAGAVICGIQDRHVVAVMKHFALNDQETGRFTYSADINESGMRESDLFAFQIALERSNPGAVMCAYNRVNALYACQNSHLLNEILKRDWAFPGWVMSDWGAVRASDAAVKGLDQESDSERDSVGAAFFEIPPARQIDMNRRILRSMYAIGLFDDPPKISPIEYAAHAQAALEAAERGIVVLKNDATLPLSRMTPRIAVIGGFADAGVLSGGGSAQVLPFGRELLVPLGAPEAPAAFYDRSPPLAAIRAIAPRAVVSYNDGRYPSQAASLAKRADVAVVFATQWTSEGADAPSLALPDGQDSLVAAVAGANPRTIVVLETGGPVTMPWLDRVSAVIEAWYPGERGGDAVANVLFGAVDAAGRLPITFPASDAQLVHPELPGFERLLSAIASGVRGFQTAYAIGDFSVAYPDGGDAGYRRFAKDGITPLFAFGHGLSYTSFQYGDFALRGGKTLVASFSVSNTGSRAGTDTPQVYLTRRLGAPEMRLLGWAKVSLRPGERKSLSVTADPRLLADFEASANAWVIREGMYEASLGPASDRLSDRATAPVAAQTIAP